MTIFTNLMGYQSFVLKKNLPQNSTVFLWGDLHGDIRALTDSLIKLFQDEIINEELEILKGDHYFLFLGDFVGRGLYGMDTLITLFRLAYRNPGKVILVRGNHEDKFINSTDGFADQVQKVKPSLETRILGIFDILPEAVFIGCNGNYLQCCHGGYEARYNPHELLADKNGLIFEKIKEFKLLDIKKYGPITSKADKETKWRKEVTGNIFPSDLGLTWWDFNATNGTQTDYKEGRGLQIGLPFAEKVTEDYLIRGIIRAHQHNPSMPGLLNKANEGIYVLWNSPALNSRVFTLLSSTVVLGNPAFAQLTLSNSFDNWQLRSNALFGDTWKSRTSKLIEWKNVAD